MTAFVVPVKYDPANPVVVDCVASIREHHPDATVVVCDTGSDDTSYFRKIDCDIAQRMPRPYPIAAYGWAYELLAGEDAFALIHDSLRLNAPVPSPDPLLTVRYFETPPTGWGWDQHGSPLEEWAAKVCKFDLPDTFAGVFGPMWFCKRQVLDDLAALGLFDIDVADKWQLCAMERIVGIALEHCGYDPRQSIQGEMRGFHDPYDESVVAKCHPGRP